MQDLLTQHMYNLYFISHNTFYSHTETFKIALKTNGGGVWFDELNRNRNRFGK